MRNDFIMYQIHQYQTATTKVPKNGLRTACKPKTTCISNIHVAIYKELHKGAGKNAHTGDTTILVDVFMPRDDILKAKDGDMDAGDHILEFMQFCFMNKPL